MLDFADHVLITNCSSNIINGEQRRWHIRNILSDNTAPFHRTFCRCCTQQPHLDKVDDAQVSEWKVINVLPSAKQPDLDPLSLRDVFRLETLCIETTVIGSVKLLIYFVPHGSWAVWKNFMTAERDQNLPITNYGRHQISFWEKEQFMEGNNSYNSRQQILLFYLFEMSHLGYFVICSATPPTALNYSRDT